MPDGSIGRLVGRDEFFRSLRTVNPSDGGLLYLAMARQDARCRFVPSPPPRRKDCLRVLLSGCGLVVLALVTIGAVAWLSTKRPVIEWDWVDAGALSISASPLWIAGLGFISATDGEITAIDLSSGRTVWSRSLGLPPSGVAACGSGRVWTVDEGGVLHALDLVTGSEDLQINIGSAARAGVGWIQGTVLVATDDQRLLALRGSDGSHRWQCSLPDAAWQPPLSWRAYPLWLLPTRHGLILIEPHHGQLQGQFMTTTLWGGATLAAEGMWRGNHQGELHLWIPTEDSLRWQSICRARFPHAIEAAPWVEQDLLLVGTMGGQAACLDPRTGQRRWQVSTRGRLLARPVRVGPTTYWGTIDGWLEARTLASGQLVWRIPVGGPIGNDLQTDGQRVFVTTWDGQCRALRAHSSSLR